MHPLLPLLLTLSLSPIAPPPAPAEAIPAEISVASPVLEATRAYAAGSPAPVLREIDAELHPYGHSVPVVRCLPLTVCDIELQPGETVLAAATGDSARWHVETVTSGSPEALVPHVLVKPTDFGLGTNLVVTTSRRTYSLVLQSPSKTATHASDLRSLARIRFYYPDSLVKHFAEASAASAAQAERAAAATVAPLAGDPTRWNFGYTISPARHPAAPLRVLDDGVHTFLQLKPNRSRGETPALLAFAGNGDDARIVNYRVSQGGDWYIVDGTFDKAQLLLGSGRSQTKITITRETGR